MTSGLWDRLKGEAAVISIRQDLKTLAAVQRPVGSAEEQETAEYLRSRFVAMGYDVTMQKYTDDSGRTGTNVIAVKPATLGGNRARNADILVLSAHHDSVPSAYGANDNGSGAAALLAVAEAMKDVPTDTELRFISFTDEENGKNGSRFYTASLTEAERSRMIGDIQMDMLGGLGSDGLCVCTMDGEASWLSDAIQAQCPEASLKAETASDHASFQLVEVPAVLVMQEGRGYLYHSVADTADQIDVRAVAAAANAVASAAKKVASARTGSYRETARQQADGYTFRQTRQNVIHFSTSLRESEAYIGAAGTLTDRQEIGGDGWKDVYETYRYSMRWFDGETPMNTYYVYRNGYLSHIEIRPEETGYTAEQVRQLIRQMYGEPDSAQTRLIGTILEGWADEIYSKYISFEGTYPCKVTVSRYSVGVSNVRSEYEVIDGQTVIASEQDRRVWELLCRMIPEENRKKIREFQLFTDGYSNILAYTAPLQRDDGSSDNTGFSIHIDYYDVYDENGIPRDWSKLTYTILHEYGHVLLEDETQVDLSVGTDTHDPKGFVPGSFRKAFYDRFWAAGGNSGIVGNYDGDPTAYVSRYGANYFHEDIAETFALFVLGGEPQGSTVAEEKLRFFWQNEDMVALRGEIRRSLGLE